MEGIKIKMSERGFKVLVQLAKKANEAVIEQKRYSYKRILHNVAKSEKLSILDTFTVFTNIRLMGESYALSHLKGTNQ